MHPEGRRVVHHIGDVGELGRPVARRALDADGVHRRVGGGAQGVAVRGGVEIRLEPELAAGAGAVGDDEAGTGQARHHLRHDAPDHGVDAAAGREGDEDLDRPGGGQALWRLGQRRGGEQGGQRGERAAAGRHGLDAPGLLSPGWDFAGRRRVTPWRRDGARA